MHRQILPPALWTLPIELRLSIYKSVLVSRRAPNSKPSWMDSDKKMVAIGLTKGRPEWAIDPTLLRTCKQTYSEASSILYSENTFFFNDPNRFVIFLKQIGPHFKDLRNLHIWVSWRESEDWKQALRKCARDATGLRKITISWNAAEYRFWADLRRQGDDARFMRALEFSAYITRRGPDQLGKDLSVSVHSRRGHHGPLLVEKVLGKFEKYQQEPASLVL